MARISNMTIDGRVLSRLVIDGREVKIATEPVTLDCLCFTAEEANSTVKMVANGSAPVVNLQISRDGRSWTPYVMGADILLQNVDDIVYWKAVGSNEKMGSSPSNYNYFSMTGKIAASGNTNSLLEEDEDTARTMSLAGKNYCYVYLFKGCEQSLTTPPELPATELANNCYQSMFYANKALNDVPLLPATTLTDSCYQMMFSQCTALTSATELPANEMRSMCYDSMFYNCTSLTEAPELPATRLAFACYNQMFRYCTNLTQAPALPAETLVQHCYSYMFGSCTSLTSAPELPATTLASTCYQNMFNGCTSLNYVKASFTNWDPANATNYWLPNNAGTFECTQELIDNTTDRTTSTVPPNWNMKAYDVQPDCLCFTAEEANSSIGLVKHGSAPTVNLQTSTDGQSWIQYTVGDLIPLDNIGDKVYFKAIGSNTRFSSGSTNYNSFSGTGRVAGSGNINSLIEEDVDVARNVSLTNRSRVYQSLFRSCICITELPEFPSKEVGVSVYDMLCWGCTNLRKAMPELPATKLYQYSYTNMFSDCPSLTTPPEILATSVDGTGDNFSCASMFKNCTSLTYGPSVNITNTNGDLYESMYKGCINLETVPDFLNLGRVGMNTFKQTFQDCSKLVKAPRFELTSFSSSNQFSSTFSGCTSLEEPVQIDMTKCETIPSLPSTSTFSAMGKNYEVIVPSDLYDDWITATNWSVIASHIVRQSDYTA